MLKVIVPAKHIQSVEAYVEDQDIMTCETGLTEEGELTIVNHNHDMDHQFWEFLEDLLMFLPFCTEVKVSK